VLRLRQDALIVLHEQNALPLRYCGYVDVLLRKHLYARRLWMIDAQRHRDKRADRDDYQVSRRERVLIYRRDTYRSEEAIQKMDEIRGWSSDDEDSGDN
jgi:hypothetical protein